MRILLTNDDGIYAPGLAALERELQSLGAVTTVAPYTEQSGVGHSITFLAPLVCHEIFDGDRRRGWAVEGSPADCVKIGVMELCGHRPDLVVSGINGGLNAGINVLYSGTVAAAVEGAFFGITSIAVSLEYDPHADFARAAVIARHVIEQVLERGPRAGQLLNLNIPTRATRERSQLAVVPMGVARYGEHFIKRSDPRGRTYYWATNDPPPKPTDHETDLTALTRGQVTLSPLDFDLTRHQDLERLNSWKLSLPE
ncbi:MAG: 5'/3'-nucleotidase SurE [Pirellulales bacterium]